MAKEGVLKENVDGEALLWALSRLNLERARRKLLFVLSDGAPVDDSTLSVNQGHFLESHLKSVVAGISGMRGTTLKAIGINHDVSRYYPEALTSDSASLGLGVLGLLESCLPHRE
jgi:cobaltochelatase CobT